MCDLLKKLRKARRKSDRKLLKTILSKLETLMAASEELLTRVSELEQNAADTTARITEVAGDLSTTRTELEAVRVLLAEAQGNTTAIEEANVRLGALVSATQANEDSLLALVPPAPPVE
jgi:predicted transcriptional regulator